MTDKTLRIYKISSPHTDKVYIGSTYRTIKRRLQNHVESYKRYRDGRYNYVTSFDILEFGDYKIEELDSLEKATAADQIRLERKTILEHKNACNKTLPGGQLPEVKKERAKAKRDAKRDAKPLPFEVTI